MALSERALRMLRRGRIHPHPSERSQIVACIERAGLPVFVPIVEFEERYGGIEYDIRGSGKSGLRLGLVPEWADHRHAERTGLRVVGWGQQGRYFFECAQHPVAQCSFLLNDAGVLHIDGVPVATTIETYIELDAVVDGLQDEQPEWLQLVFGNAPRGDREVDERLDRLGLSILPEASDIYATAWRGNGLWVERRVFWDGRGDRDRLVAYVATEGSARELIDALRGTSFRSDPVRRTWPVHASTSHP